MRKKLILFILGGVFLSLTGCNIASANKVLVCTATDSSNSTKQELKYVMTFNKDGTILEKVDASINFLSDNINTSMIEDSFCNNADIIKDSCKVIKNKKGDVEIVLSRKVLESDEVILGDFYIDGNENYESIINVFEKEKWNNVNWSCK